ncbi:ATP-binding protein [Saccharopolyspora sp. HNM0983]|uniref:ATP-binding protein n=1 Tax=Saccharopolyspora montiporae TaxID=2781240 RepID=A0A929FW64_9PSEU|nr:ATP-binding protein [Saccharopolyspora sp. HNM0983]MBE9373206.1 ATP-binding protein [Saccharopolyspora sp. HNM0983]
MSVEREVAQVEPEAADADLVEVRVAADPTQLAVLRAVVGDLAMRADFDVDSIADMRLAVDEVCSSLIRLAAPSSKLVCRFRTGGDGIAVAAEVHSTDGLGPRKDTFSWRVLSALADSVSTSVASDEAADGSHLVRIELTKGRAAQV